MKPRGAGNDSPVPGRPVAFGDRPRSEVTDRQRADRDPDGTLGRSPESVGNRVTDFVHAAESAARRVHDPAVNDCGRAVVRGIDRHERQGVAVRVGVVHEWRDRHRRFKIRFDNVIECRGWPVDRRRVRCPHRDRDGGGRRCTAPVGHRVSERIRPLVSRFGE